MFAAMNIEAMRNGHFGALTLLCLYHRFVQVRAKACRSKEKGLKNQAFLLNGGAKRDRTADLYNAIVALSQLSYGPVVSRLRLRCQLLCREGGAFRHSLQGLST